MALTKVITKYGTVRGAAENGYTLFKGIPYAAPPVGERRFAAPVPPKPWEGEKDCTKWPEISVQEEGRNQLNNPVDVPKWVGSEDCLTLNIWTGADSSGEKLPILFWIHGGGFCAGSGFSGCCDGASYCKRGVILVSVQFRVGVFGFLGLKKLAERDPHGATGNYGYEDILEALRWVQENIAAFGGDPDRVTVIGQSSGAMTVKWLIGCEAAKGLFHRGIAMSGGGTWDIDPVLSFEEKCAYSQKALDLLGWSFEDLMEMDASVLCSGMKSVIPRLGLPVKSLACNLFQPSVDHYLVQDYYGKRIFEGKTLDVDVMCGTIRGESRNFVYQVPDGIAGYEREFALSPGIAWGRRYIELGKKPIYHYFFDHDLPGENGYPMHGSDMPYTFNTLERVNRPWQEYDHLIAETAADYWCSFARNGDPNTEGRPEWPAFTAEHPVSMCFGNEGIGAKDLGSDEKEDSVVKFLLEEPGLLTRPFLREQ